MSDSETNGFFDRCLIDELKRSLGILDSIDETNLHERIHELRKSLKRLRGWLRAARPHKNAKIYNRELSSIGKEISSLRDSTSALESMERLRDKFGPWLKNKTFNDLEKYLQKERYQLTHSKRPVLIRIRARLEMLLGTFEPFGFTDISDLYDGIKNTYDHSRKAIKELEFNMNAEAYHELRKRTKDLQNQLLFFPDEMIKTTEENLKTITTLLGNDQDLYLLEDSLKESSFNSGSKEVLQALINSEHDHLKSTALDLARLVFDMSSRKFILKLTKRRNIMENTEGQVE